MELDETTKASPDSVSGEDQRQGSDESQGSSLEPTTRSFTEQELEVYTNKIRSDAFAQAGDRYKPIESENVTLKSQLATNQKLIKDGEEKLDRLNQRFDELAKDDPDKLKLVKLIRDAEVEMDKLKQRESDLNEFEQKNREKFERSERFEMEVLCTRIAEDYESADSNKLIALAGNLKDKSESSIRIAADTMWVRKSVQTTPQNRVTVPDDGMTKGGTNDEAIRKNYRENPNNPKAYKDYQEYLKRMRGF